MSESLETVWTTVNSSLGISREVSDKWFDEIKRKYREQQRHYHTLQHIRDLVSLYEEYKHNLRKPQLILLAIFFHDVIYDPTRGDNEEQSAELFASYAAETNSLIPDDTLTVKNVILATKSHIAVENGHDDEHYMLDMDMAILGSHESVYDKYASQIRSEYCHYSDNEYNQGRTKVLKGFRDKQRIYSTACFYDRFESAARTNIDREISALEGRTINYT